MTELIYAFVIMVALLLSYLAEKKKKNNISSLTDCSFISYIRI